MRDSATGAPSTPAQTPRRSTPPGPPPAWKETHRLRWVPSSGRGLEWLVQIEHGARDGRPLSFARTEDEAQARLPASWVLDGETWLWNGRRGFLGGEGSVRLVPLASRR